MRHIHANDAPRNSKYFGKRIPYLCLQNHRPVAEAIRVVGATSALNNLRSSHEEGMRFFEIALSAKSFARAAYKEFKQSRTTPSSSQQSTMSNAIKRSETKAALSLKQLVSI